MAKKTIKKTEEVAATSPFIIGPRVTEKSAYAAEKGQYVFNVATDANKIQIKKAVADQYKVTVTDVNIVVSKPKTRVFRGRKGTEKAFKKAYVTLKKGDTIEIN